VGPGPLAMPTRLQPACSNKCFTDPTHRSAQHISLDLSDATSDDVSATAATASSACRLTDWPTAAAAANCRAGRVARREVAQLPASSAQPSRKRLDWPRLRSAAARIKLVKIAAALLDAERFRTT
jgi:hypothetical protein